MFQSLQIACDYRSRQFDSPARWADLCPHRAEAKVIFLPFKVPSTPNQGCLAYVVFASAQSQRVNHRCLYGCITKSVSTGANWLCIIAGSTTSDDRIFPGQGTQLSATSPLPCPLSDLWRSPQVSGDTREVLGRNVLSLFRAVLCQSWSSLLYYVYSVYI